MISHFLNTCTPLLVRSVWQWKLIFFSLIGDITMINFSMEWRKLEDCCNIRSEINLLWCEESQGMWGINKYEITLSVFLSNRKRASFGRALLCWKCDPLWPSLGWKELGNEILSIYRPLFQDHTSHLCGWWLENQFRGKDKGGKKSNSVAFCNYSPATGLMWIHYRKLIHTERHPNPYVIVEHVIPKPRASICCCSSLCSSGFSLSSRCWTLLQGFSPIQPPVRSITDVGW